MDLDRLRYFVTISRLGSLARAAEVLHLSSPALSKAMATLESELGRELFVRDGRQLVLSDAGERLLPQAESLLKQADALQRDVVATSSTTLRIASFEVFTTHLLGPLAKELLGSKRDATELELFEALPGEIEQAVSTRRVDFGLSYAPIPTAGLDFLKVTTITMGIYGRAASFKDHSFDELPFAVPLAPLAGTPTRARGLDGWPDDRVTRHTPFRVTLMESALELCRQGLAVAWLPHFVVRHHNAKLEPKWRLTIVIDPPFKQTRADLWLVKRRGAQEDHAAKALARAIRLACKDAP